MADTVYEWGMAGLVAADIDWDADDIKVALVDTDDYTLDSVNDKFLSDIPGGAIVATSAALTGKAVTAGVATADDAAFTSVTGDQAEALVVYQSTGVDSTSRLITYVDSAAGLPFAPNGEDVTVAWTGGVVFYLSGLQGSLIIVVADATERLALTSSDGDLVWQTDTNELYVYVDGATPTWGLIYPAAGGGSLNQLRFDYTGSSQTWTVPDGVYSAAVTAVGASGGSSNASGSEGVSGARVEAIISTTPAETLNIYVGGKGTDSPGNSTSTGGYNGGGDGVNGGGGGGGATDIRQGGTALSDRILVAGGAGGTGANDSITIGGRGGAPTGETGISGYPSNSGCGVAGGGATTSAGGVGGTGGGTGSAGTDGSLGTGGTGGASADAAGRGGAGGGGGYYGGGGGEGGQTSGDSGGGGGGGSSLAPANGESDARIGIGRTNGYLIISWVE